MDDLPDDLEDGSYNPYILSRRLSPGDGEGMREIREYSLLTLNACLAECAAAYNLLDIHRFDGILRNVLEWGMPAVQRDVLAGKKRKKRDKGEPIPSVPSIDTQQ